MSNFHGHLIAWLAGVVHTSRRWFIGHDLTNEGVENEMLPKYNLSKNQKSRNRIEGNRNRPESTFEIDENYYYFDGRFSALNLHLPKEDGEKLWFMAKEVFFIHTLKSNPNEVGDNYNHGIEFGTEATTEIHQSIEIDKPKFEMKFMNFFWRVNEKCSHVPHILCMTLFGSNVVELFGRVCICGPFSWITHAWAMTIG